MAGITVNDILEMMEENSDRYANDGEYGQIDGIALPTGWVPGELLNNVVGNSSFKQFHPPADKETKLAFYYRGRRTSEAAGRNFHNLLLKPPHILAKHEYESVSEALRDKSNLHEFQLHTARTENLNGKIVLVVEGRFKQIQEDVRFLLVDSDGTGTAVQEIFYQSPKTTFLKHLSQAKVAMNSIQWK